MNTRYMLAAKLDLFGNNKWFNASTLEQAHNLKSFLLGVNYRTVEIYVEIQPLRYIPLADIELFKSGIVEA